MSEQMIAADSDKFTLAIGDNPLALWMIVGEPNAVHLKDIDNPMFSVIDVLAAVRDYCSNLARKDPDNPENAEIIKAIAADMMTTGAVLARPYGQQMGVAIDPGKLH